MAAAVWCLTLKGEDGEVYERVEGIQPLKEAERQRDIMIVDLETQGYRWFKGGIIRAVYWPPDASLPLLTIECRSDGK